ncbi:MAG: mandelate racemase/muconate lactonizing enzyme family protein [Pseudomonadota bacterium]
MKISAIKIYKVPLTSHKTYYMGDGKACATLDTIVVKIETDAGIGGFGEVCPIPHYLPAYAEGVVPAIEELAPLLIGADPMGVERVMGKVDHWLKGHGYAKSPLDIALWDLNARALGVPVYQLLGGAYTKSVPTYHSITCVEPDDMARIAKDVQTDGIEQFQVKLGADDDWQADAERLIRVREAVGPGPLVYGDWNCSATKLDATRVGRAVSHLDIMLEQPCETIEECGAVRHATGLPMKLDECVSGIDQIMKANALECMDVVTLKIAKFGGLTPTKKGRDLLMHFGVKVCAECMWGSDIITAASVHLAAATPPRYLQNVCDLSGYVAPRLAPDGPVRQGGRIQVSDAPGLGVTPDEDTLGAPIAHLN